MKMPIKVSPKNSFYDSLKAKVCAGLVGTGIGVAGMHGCQTGRDIGVESANQFVPTANWPAEGIQFSPMPIPIQTWKVANEGRPTMSTKANWSLNPFGGKSVTRKIKPSEDPAQIVNWLQNGGYKWLEDTGIKPVPLKNLVAEDGSPSELLGNDKYLGLFGKYYTFFEMDKLIKKIGPDVVLSYMHPTRREVVSSIMQSHGHPMFDFSKICENDGLFKTLLSDAAREQDPNRKNDLLSSLSELEFNLSVATGKVRTIAAINAAETLRTLEPGKLKSVIKRYSPELPERIR